MDQKTAERPLVSLVIPVYNSMPYLLETLDAIPKQGLDADELEVILVNDGSDDGSETVLAEYAEKNPNYRLLNQPNSGGPADPCNKGIAAVRGKYFFVVGSDDVLTDRALGDLVAYAEKEGSDIVLAKMAGINGRHAPGSMFTASKADADLVKDRLFNSLTAIKLFRTELVTKTGAHNPTHLRIGSDQPFTAACYLVARKISVRADRPYVMIRKREDGRNVTSNPRNAIEYTDLLVATVDVIVKWTEPGELRDGVLHRPMQSALRKALLPRFLDLDEEKQEGVVSEIQRIMAPLFNDAVAAHLGSLDRVKARLALAGRMDELRRLITWEKDKGAESLIHEPGGFRLDLPTELAEAIGPELLRDAKIVGVATLEDLLVEHGRVRMDISALVRRCTTAPDAVDLRLRRRGTDEWTDVPVPELQPLRRAGANGLRGQVEIDATQLDHAVWDLCVVQRFGDDELENRLGRNRADRVTQERRLLIDETDAHRELGTAYFTQGYGNLSLDVGYVLLARNGPQVSIAGVLQIRPDRQLALLRTDPEDTVQVSAVRAAGDRTGDRISTVRLDSGLLAVSLPATLPATERRLRVANAHGSVVLTLPAAVDVSEGSGPSSAPPELLTRALDGGGRRARSLARRLGVRRPAFLRRPGGRSRR